MRRIVNLFLSLSVLLLVSLESFGTGRFQTPVGGGGILEPIQGQNLLAGVPVTLRWQVDSPAAVASQDLALSTDGGRTFPIMIAANFPSQQRQLIWSAATPLVNAAARLQVLLRYGNGQTSRIISGDFSILAAQPGSASVTTSSTKKSSNGVGPNTGDVEPAFAGSGTCVSGTLPSLNYNMGNTSDGTPYNWGEPALAQDPNDPSHFFTATGSYTRGAKINSTGVNWQYSGTASFSQLSTPNGFSLVGDLTTEIALDSTVYVVATASSDGTSINTLMIFRSKTFGATFEPGVAIPIPAEITYVDKPVIAVHPNDKQTLVITFDNTSNHWLAICNKAATGTLADPTIWSFTKPLTSSGVPFSINFTLHPLIDPVSPTSSFYWLFLVQTDDNIGPGDNTGYRIEQYQVTNRASASTIGLPVRERLQAIGYPNWTISNLGCTAIELAVRASNWVSGNCYKAPGNLPKAAIDYCDATAHRMYIPVLANTLGLLVDGLTSDLFVSVWQYTGTESVIIKRILPQELHKYNACAVTDGHGRVWLNCYAVTSAANSVNQNVDYQTAQYGTIAINRITGDAGTLAYISTRIPQDRTIPNPIQFFLGDYVYSQAAFYPTSNGSRVAEPTFTDLFDPSGNGYRFWIGVSGWQ